MEGTLTAARLPYNNTRNIDGFISQQFMHICPARAGLYSEYEGESEPVCEGEEKKSESEPASEEEYEFEDSDSDSELRKFAAEIGCYLRNDDYPSCSSTYGTRWLLGPQFIRRHSGERPQH
jgi:hypothetical protein